MKTTSSLVTFCGGDATFCQITVYTYGSAAVLPKHVCQQHCASEQVYTLWFILRSNFWRYALVHRGQSHMQ